MAKQSEPAKRAMAKYRKAHTKQFSMTFFPADMPLYDHLQAQPNKAAYIKGLIVADMERRDT